MWIGRISYSIDLVHMSVLFVGLTLLRELVPWTRGWDAIGIASAVALALVTSGVASLTYRCIERPMMHAKRNTVARAPLDGRSVEQTSVRSAA